MTKKTGDSRTAVLGKKDLDYNNVFNILSRQVPQSAAQYDPMGMNDGKACANCHFFMSPDGCLMVDGDISPTGFSRFWMPIQKPEQSPMPVTVMSNDATSMDSSLSLGGKGKEGSFLHTVAEKVKSLFVLPIIEEPAVFGDSSMMFYKGQEPGAPLRFLATVSNNFQDRDTEIISEEAHKEYVEWATKSNNYPELWLWHASAESKWGQVDWLDVTDGFLVASGTVDAGKEFLAKNLASDPDGIGVSHGFYKKEANGVISKYRTFEISPLPLWAAANEWTSFNLWESDVMSFTPQKKAWLIEKGMTPEDVTKFEATLGTISKELKSRGVDWKDFTPEPVAAVVTPPKEAAPAATTTPEGTLSSKEYVALDTRIVGIETSVKELTDAVTKGMASLMKSKDDSTADFFKSAVAQLPQGFQASDATGNTPAMNPAAKAIADRDIQQKDSAWFQEIVVGGMALK